MLQVLLQLLRGFWSRPEDVLNLDTVLVIVWVGTHDVVVSHVIELSERGRIRTSDWRILTTLHTAPHSQSDSPLIMLVFPSRQSLTTLVGTFMQTCRRRNPV